VTATDEKPMNPANAATRGPDVEKYVTLAAVAPKAGAQNAAAVGENDRSDNRSSMSY
jgi:hypothetical protein